MTALTSSPARVSRTPSIFIFMLKVPISSAFLESRTKKRANFQNCRTIARGAMRPNAARSG
jgi:hypothetical protein